MRHLKNIVCWFFKDLYYRARVNLLHQELSYNDLIDILAYTFRLGKQSIILPYLSDDFVFRSEWILFYPKDKAQSLEWMREYVERDSKSKMIKEISPYTGNLWLRFSNNPHCSHLGIMTKNGKMRLIALCSKICDY